MKLKGNCYATCEALYHLLGGKAAGYVPMTVRHNGSTHWFLKKLDPDHVEPAHGPFIILDPTVSQFKKKPNYGKARGRGFLTKEPSKRARALISLLVGQC